MLKTVGDPTNSSEGILLLQQWVPGSGPALLLAGSNRPGPRATLGPGDLTWQSSQHSPWAQTASGFRVQVVALQQRFVHSWGGEGVRWSGSQGATARESKHPRRDSKKKREPGGPALELKTEDYLHLYESKTL